MSNAFVTVILSYPTHQLRCCRTVGDCSLTHNGQGSHFGRSVIQSISQS